jgi:hypothetical protein
MRVSRQLRRIADGIPQGDYTELAREIDALGRWVFPLSIGVSPATHDEVRAVIGRMADVDLGGRPRPVYRPNELDPSNDELRRASSVTCEIVLRLWAMGSLAPGRGDDQIVALAQTFLEEPSGYAAGDKASGPP